MKSVHSSIWLVVMLSPARMVIVTSSLFICWWNIWHDKSERKTSLGHQGKNLVKMQSRSRNVLEFILSPSRNPRSDWFTWQTHLFIFWYRTIPYNRWHDFILFIHLKFGTNSVADLFCCIIWYQVTCHMYHTHVGAFF